MGQGRTDRELAGGALAADRPPRLDNAVNIPCPGPRRARGRLAVGGWRPPAGWLLAPAWRGTPPRLTQRPHAHPARHDRDPWRSSRAPAAAQHGPRDMLGAGGGTRQALKPIQARTLIQAADVALQGRVEWFGGGEGMGGSEAKGSSAKPPARFSFHYDPARARTWKLSFQSCRLP